MGALWCWGESASALGGAQLLAKPAGRQGQHETDDETEHLGGCPRVEGRRRLDHRAPAAALLLVPRRRRLPPWRATALLLLVCTSAWAWIVYRKTRALDIKNR